MAKPEWGVKRTCQSCGARFYDMAHSPIVCPKCGSTVEPEVTFKSRRQAAVVVPEPKVVPIVVDEEIADLEGATEEIDTADEEETETAKADGDEEEEEESALIEDASDLGEDDDDMAEVMEHIDEDLENEI
ncbi:TIGR02300 family protein [Telmatospirillum sp.]|uniref:TIGR02300 family protein n=1 Tax=Telmatospirillum sp. TaxID=2079197 RepID=UPI00283AC907|nr:TIGR02300 family protein [Telmatospirillum sp.]MDR3440348.1 TIGR02300 family protein [Telmatospirillum sp.]